jgi:hypothetical protein
MSRILVDDVALRLREWASGSLPMGAGVELLARAFGGRFADRSRPWIITEPDGRVWVDVDMLGDASGALSGGERRIVAMVVALLDDRLVDVVDVVTGLDRQHLHLVLASLAHAAGSHEHAALTLDPDGVAHLTRPGPVVAWPT